MGDLSCILVVSTEDLRKNPRLSVDGLGFSVTEEMRKDEWQGQTTVLTAQGAKVTNSPVASGIGITPASNSSTTVAVSWPEAPAPITAIQFFPLDRQVRTTGCFGKAAFRTRPIAGGFVVLGYDSKLKALSNENCGAKLFVNQNDWPLKEAFFRAKSSPMYRFEKISLMSNDKEGLRIAFCFFSC